MKNTVIINSTFEEGLRKLRPQLDLLHLWFCSVINCNQYEYSYYYYINIQLFSLLLLLLFSKIKQTLSN